MKLPDITYGRASSPSAGPGPQVAVRAAYERKQIVNAGFKAAEEVGTAYRDFELRKHDAEYQNEMSDFRTKAATMKVATPAEIKALGLDDVIDTEGKEFIPKSEWYPVALERMMEKNKEKYASRIKSPKDRTKWTQEMDTHNNQILLRETEIAAKESEEHLESLKKVSVDEGIRTGNFETALATAQTINDPEERSRQVALVGVASDRETIRDDIDSIVNGGNSIQEQVSELDALAVTLRSDEHNESSSLNADQLAEESERIKRLSKSIAKGAVESETQVYKQNFRSYYNAYSVSEDWTGMISGLSSADWMNPKDKDWVETKALAKIAGTPIVTNDADLDKLEDMLTLDPAQFLAEEISMYHLSEEDENTMQGKQRDMERVRLGGTPSETALAYDDYVTGALDVSIPQASGQRAKSANKLRAQARRTIESALLLVQQRNNGEVLDRNAAYKVIDNEIAKMYGEPGIFGGTSITAESISARASVVEGYRAEGFIPKEEMTLILSSIRAHNMAVRTGKKEGAIYSTDYDTLYRFYNQGLEK